MLSSLDTVIDLCYRKIQALPKICCKQFGGGEDVGGIIKSQNLNIQKPQMIKASILWTLLFMSYWIHIEHWDINALLFKTNTLQSVLAMAARGKKKKKIKATCHLKV